MDDGHLGDITKLKKKQHYCLLMVPNNQIFFKFCTIFNFVIELELGLKTIRFTVEFMVQ
jgi:hypothetical protein